MSSKKNKGRAQGVEKPASVAGKAAEVPAVKVEGPETRLLKEETLVWLFSILCSLAVYLVAAMMIQKAYQPDVSALKASAAQLLIDAGSVRPEPVEAMLFRVGVVLISVGLLAFYVLFSKMKQVRALAGQSFFVPFVGICIAFVLIITYAGFAAQNPFVKDGGDIPQNSRDFIGKSNFDFYFDGLFLGKYLFVYAFLLVPLMAVMFFLGIKKNNWEENKTFNRVVTIAGYGVFGLTVLAILGMSCFYFPYSFETKYNFNAVYYSMTQVYSGSPMLVDGFTNTYGLYPHFLNLLFKVIGLNVLKFSTVMGLLTAVAFTMNLFTMQRFVKNRVILFLGLFTVIFFPFMDFKLGQNFDCNFAVYPIRYIIPAFLLLMATVYLKKRSAIVYWITTFALAFFVLWNPEIGIVCYISWLAFHLFNDFYSRGKVAVRKLAVHVAASVGVVVTVCYLYKFLVYLAYGTSPDLSQLFATITVFGKIGFNMLPMSAIHPWHLMAITLVIGFVYAISHWHRKDVTPRAAMIFLLTVLSTGFFFYFQGRSHNWQLAQSSGMCLILLTLLGDELWDRVKNHSIMVLNALFVVFLFFISFSFFELVYNSDKIREMVSQEDDKDKQAEEQKLVEGNHEFIVKNTKDHERIYVFSAIQHQGLYFDGNNRRSAFNPGLGEMFLKSDAVKLEKELADSSFTVFMETNSNYPMMERPAAALAATYEITGANKTMGLFKKRKTKVPVGTFLNRAGQSLFHKKYTDDAAGIEARINDASGTKAIDAGPSLSVEVLFFPQEQIYQYATLIGNMSDTSGFVIAKIAGSANYFFGVNGKGAGVAITPNQWTYCVMNVFPDHMEIFVNGVQAGTFPLAQAMRKSPGKVAVGNLGFLRNYIGAIAEVSVNSAVLDIAQVGETWNRIKQ